MAKKVVVRNVDGSPVASYDHLSEANTYVEHSYPDHTISAIKGQKAQTLNVVDPDGVTQAYIEVPDGVIEKP